MNEPLKMEKQIKR